MANLLYTADELTALKAQVGTPPYDTIYAGIKTWGDAHINDDVPAYNGYQVHYTVKRFIETMIFLYDMESDTKYRDAAVEWMLGVCAWTNWRAATGSNHWQTTSYVQVAVSIGYYRLKSELSAENKATILDALTSSSYGGYEVLRYGGSLTTPTFGYSYFPSGFPNHESTVGSATGICALALGADYANSAAWLSFAEDCVEYAFGLAGTDGGWIEGASYFNFSMCSLVLFADIRNRAGSGNYFTTYSDFLSHAATYARYMTVHYVGTQYRIQMEDCTGDQEWSTNGEPVWSYRLAKEFDDTYAQEFGIDFADSDYIYSYIWRDSTVSEGDHTGLDKVVSFNSIGYLIARDSWDDTSATIVVFKSGRSLGHAHPNQNMFEIYKNGFLLTGGLGYLNTYTEYQTSTLNNCITQGELQGKDGIVYGSGQAREPGDIGSVTVTTGTKGSISGVASNTIYAHVKGDASDLYTGETEAEYASINWIMNSSGDATAVTRDLVWVLDPNYIVIYDAIDQPTEQQINWKINTQDIDDVYSGANPPTYIYNATTGVFSNSFSGHVLEVKPIIPASFGYSSNNYPGTSAREFSLLNIYSTNGENPRLVTVLSPSDILSAGTITTATINTGNCRGVRVDSSSYTDLVLFSSDGNAVSQWLDLGGYFQAADEGSYSFNGTSILASFSGYTVIRLESTETPPVPTYSFVYGGNKLQKNVAGQKWYVFAFDTTTNAAKTGDAANITADVYLDGVKNTIDDTNPTELAHGYYAFDVSAAETNADYIVIDVVSATSNIQVVGVPGAAWTETITAKLPTGYLMGSSDQNSHDTDIDAIKAKTDNLPSGVAKNIALSNFAFVMVSSIDHYTPATGKTVTAMISKDGGAFADATNTVAEISNGVYTLDLTQTEMNADIIVIKATASGCDQRTITIKTDT